VRRVCVRARGHSAPDGRRNLSPRGSSLVVSASECLLFFLAAGALLLVRASERETPPRPKSSLFKSILPCAAAALALLSRPPRESIRAHKKRPRSKPTNSLPRWQQIASHSARNLVTSRFARAESCFFACACARKTASRETSSTMHKL
jgi:hypothetical protein